jgi:ABC-type Fe3+ transport system permease subunit
MHYCIKINTIVKILYIGETVLVNIFQSWMTGCTIKMRTMTTTPIQISFFLLLLLAYSYTMHDGQHAIEKELLQQQQSKLAHRRKEVRAAAAKERRANATDQQQSARQASARERDQNHGMVHQKT